MSSDDLLRDYAAMKGPGCDITLLILPLPCGDLPPAARRDRLAAVTRQLKLSPASLLLRLGANLVTWIVGLRCLIALYTVINAKFTLYVSCATHPLLHPLLPQRCHSDATAMPSPSPCVCDHSVG